MMLKGMTVEYLVRRTFKVEKGMNVLMHAAAGGVGLILCQWANHLGANVIGTVGSKDKAALAKANGCHHTILYRDEDFVARVKEITGGKLCEVVYDGIGKTTFPASLDCLQSARHVRQLRQLVGPDRRLQHQSSCRPRARCLRRGRRSIPMPPSARTCCRSPTACSTSSASGAVKIPINQKYALKDAAKAHKDLESRATTGSSILVP